MNDTYSNYTSNEVLFDGVAPPGLKMSSLLLWAYISVIVLGGSLTNGSFSVYLARRSPVLLQLCLTDIASLLLLAPYELFVLAGPAGVWRFHPGWCPIFAGLEVLLGTATIYLLIVLNFSSVIGSESTSQKVPLVTVWLISVSLSVPDFVLAEVVLSGNQYGICCVPKKAAFLIGAFRLSLPVLLLVVGLFVDIFVWFRTDKDRFICLPLVLSLTYLGLSVQRNVFGMLYCLYPPNSAHSFRTPPLADVVNSPAANLCLSMIHYSLSAVRPLISWLVLPDVQSVAEESNDSNEV